MADEATLKLVIETREAIQRVEALEAAYRDSVKAMAEAVSRGVGPGTDEFERLNNAIEDTAAELLKAGGSAKDAMSRLASETGLGEDAVAELEHRLRKAQDETEKLGGDSKELGKSFGELRGVIAAVGAALVAIGVSTAIRELAQQGRAAVEAHKEQAAALAQVVAGIKSTGGAAGLTVEQLQKMASGLQQVSNFGDEQILKDVTANLLTFTNITKTEFPAAQQAIVDIATRMDKDLLSVTLQVGKALNDPIKGLSALGEAGIQFSEQQKAVIEGLVETGKVAEAQRLILAELQKQYGGSAEAAKAADLNSQALKNTLSDLSEEIGKELAPNVAQLNQLLIDFASEHGDTVVHVAGQIGDGLGLVLEVLGPVAEGFDKLGKNAEEKAESLRRLANPLTVLPELAKIAGRSLGEDLAQGAGLATTAVLVGKDAQHDYNEVLRKFLELRGEAIKQAPAYDESLVKTEAGMDAAIKAAEKLWEADAKLTEELLGNKKALDEQAASLQRVAEAVKESANAEQLQAIADKAQEVVDAYKLIGEDPPRALSVLAASSTKAKKEAEDLAKAQRDLADSTKQAADAARDLAQAQTSTSPGFTPRGDQQALEREKQQLEGTVEALEDKQRAASLTAEELARLTQASDRLADVERDLSTHVERATTAIEGASDAQQEWSAWVGPSADMTAELAEKYRLLGVAATQQTGAQVTAAEVQREVVKAQEEGKDALEALTEKYGDLGDGVEPLLAAMAKLNLEQKNQTSVFQRGAGVAASLADAVGEGATAQGSLADAAKATGDAIRDNLSPQEKELDFLNKKATAMKAVNDEYERYNRLAPDLISNTTQISSGFERAAVACKALHECAKS